MTVQEWRVLDGEGKEQGPYSLQDLQSFYTSGNITHETMIWTEGLEEWVPAGRVEGLLPEIQQLIPLAPAPTVAATQPAAVEGVNLSPQIPGVSPGGSKAKSPAKTGAPIWLSIVTIASGVIALVLYFFPWVSVSQDMNFFKVEKKIIKLATQTGIQSIIQTETVTDEAILQKSNQTGILENKILKPTPFDTEEDDSQGKGNYSSSTLNLIALIAIGIGVFLALIGLLNKTKPLTLIAQILFSASAILIGVQMAQQFPMIKAYIEFQEEQKELVKAALNVASEEAELISKREGQDVQSETENSADFKRQEIQKKNTMAKAKAVTSHRYATAFEASCFVTVVILGLSILLVVVTVSSDDDTTIIVTSTRFQPQSLHGQPQQPGAGLRFH